MSSNGLGTFVRERRMDLGLTQEQLAERIGGNVSQAEVSRIERGQIVLPRRERLVAMAAALQVTPGMLLISSGWLSADEGSMVDGMTEAVARVEAALDVAVLDELGELRSSLFAMIERIVQLELSIRARMVPSERPQVIMHTGVFDDWETTQVFPF